MRHVWITTPDNPFNPVTNYDQWQAYDHEKGYNTTEYLARVAVFPNNMGDEAILESIEEAVDSIVALYPKGTYIKVVEGT